MGALLKEVLFSILHKLLDPIECDIRLKKKNLKNAGKTTACNGRDQRYITISIPLTSLGKAMASMVKRCISRTPLGPLMEIALVACLPCIFQMCLL